MSKWRRAAECHACLVPAPMEVFAVTVFMSLCFAALFAALFFAERMQRGRRSIEQMSLLPLEGESSIKPKSEHHDHR